MAFLQDIITDVLIRSKKPLSIKVITEIISREQLWRRPQDNQFPGTGQVSARVSKYHHLFQRENGIVSLKNQQPASVLIANITWNPFGWRNNNYINPKAGHGYARKNVAGESMNFNFNKTTIDTSKYIYGFVQWTNAPAHFHKHGLIFFYTHNTDLNKGQIVGIYGKADVLTDTTGYIVPFQKTEYWTNLKAEKSFSLLFPVPLDANKYKVNSSDRMVGQVGYTYKNIQFAEHVLFDELMELTKAGTNESEFRKVVTVYEYYTGKTFKPNFVSADEKEQKEIESYLKKTKTKAEILEDLKNLDLDDSEEVLVNRKTYKRDNKTIAELKILRDFKCQVCGTYIVKKDGSRYVEAAHIKPKFQRGRETPDNIILFCPNHHKEFDFGDLEILIHTIEKIDFRMNRVFYSIKLSLENL